MRAPVEVAHNDYTEKSGPQRVRDLFEKEEFFDIFVDTPFDLAESRDPKGLYKKALSGAIPNFTGINSPNEEPENPALVLDTSKLTINECLKIIIDYLEEKNAIRI